MRVAQYRVAVRILNHRNLPACCRPVLKSRPAKTWGPVDGRGHAMFGWRMEEEAKLEFTITAVAITLAGFGKLASRRRQHRDDAIEDAGPRRLPLGRRCGFATRGRQTNSRAATRDCEIPALQADVVESNIEM
jgi:hypothetical protein